MFEAESEYRAAARVSCCWSVGSVESVAIVIPRITYRKVEQCIIFIVL